MKLKDVELIPGVVVEDKDPMYLGRVKVAAPGEFDVDTMDIRDMFWVYPILPQWGYQGFSRLLKGSKVWLIKNTANYYEYWYIPYFEMNDNTFNVVNTDEKYVADVVISRIANSMNVQFYYNDLNGFCQILGFANINMRPDGTIFINSGGSDRGASNIYMNAKVNQIGWDPEEDKYQWAARGENLAAFIGDLQKDLTNLATLAKSSPYTAHLEPGFTKAAKTCGNYVKSDDKDVRSDHVKIN